MVQLSPSRTIETLIVEKEDGQGSPKFESPRVLTALQLALSPDMTTYYGYEKYIEDGLICLKHKIRNIEKKKVPYVIWANEFYCIQVELVVLFDSSSTRCPSVMSVCDFWHKTKLFLFRFTAETGKLQWEAEKGGQTKSRPTGNCSSLYVLYFGKWRSLMCGNVVGSCGEVRGGCPQS